MVKIKQDPAQLNIYKKSELEANNIGDCELRLHTESEFSLSAGPFGGKNTKLIKSLLVFNRFTVLTQADNTFLATELN